MSLRIKCPAFRMNETIPQEFTGEGEDLSPPLEWQGIPPGTRELALICDDPDAPQVQPWVPWLLYKIPPTTTFLPKNIPALATVDEPFGAVQGINSFGNLGYGGPYPPVGHGRHRYYFRLYALDCEIDRSSGLSKSELLREMEGHVLAETTVVGVYARSSAKKAG
jgi:Raf kinase inhibitor-like YbhB/YbcL family protein